MRESLYEFAENSRPCTPGMRQEPYCYRSLGISRIGSDKLTRGEHPSANARLARSSVSIAKESRPSAS